MAEKPKIFMSYSSEDKEIADDISNKLKEAGFEFSSSYNLNPGDSIISLTRRNLESSDYLIVLISQAALKSDWVKFEMSEALSKDWFQREITVLPVIIEKCRIPDYLKKSKWIDISKNYIKGIKKMIEQIEIALKIDLRKLCGPEFENLIVDLLKSYQFEDVRQQTYFIRDWRYDFMAKYDKKDPFGRHERETWIIEVKSSKDVTGLSSLRQFVASLNIFKEPVHGLFVTSGQLSRDAKAWLERQYGLECPIKILEGNEIKRLLLNNEKLVQKYFYRGE